MLKHIKIYTDYFEIGQDDKPICEIPNCNQVAVDCHHILGRGKGKDEIWNLIGLCREHHNDAHNNIISKEELINIHNANL